MSVRGKLLIAAPSLFDYFRRTVVLVLEHTPEGAMGVVLGRETETRVADVVPQLADLPGADDRVYLGGPVSPESVVALGDFDEPEEAGLQIVGSLGTLDPDCANQSLRRLRVFAGYAGWAPGQLDDELEAGRVDRAGGRARRPVPLRRHLAGGARPQGRPLPADGDDAGRPLAQLGQRRTARATARARAA